jgi:D-amino-acid dehydrogenase
MKVIVLGAGVNGVVSAYFLARAGHQVRVIEKKSASALACSKANGGQLSYSHVETWAAKESFWSIIKAAFAPNSFLTISNIFSADFFKWLYEFCKNSTHAKSYENSQKLLLLSLYSKKALQEILTNEDIYFNYQNKGILHFYRNPKLLDAAISKAQAFGCAYKVLNAEECVKKEPTLVRIFDEKKLAGGIFYEIDASGDCHLFTQSLAEICHKKYGVIFEYEAVIKNIFTNYKKITGINTNKGVFTADKYVSTLGAFGNKLLRGVGINTKIYPLRGYSLSIQADDEFIAPKIALSDIENKIVYSRIGDIFRAAGTIEIASLNAKENKKNFNFLSKIIHKSFSDFGNFNEVKKWSDFRPFRPNSLPLICETKKYRNLLINAGHGSLGWTLSAASGKILANLVDDKKDENFAFLEDENL